MGIHGRDSTIQIVIDALITGRNENGQAAVFQVIGAAKNVSGAQL